MNFFKGISNLLKTGAMLFIFELIISFFSIIVIGLDKESQMIWAVLLTVMFLATVFVFIWLLSASAAYKDFNTKRNNDLRLKNGEDVPAYKRLQEYRWLVFLRIRSVIWRIISAFPV